MRQDLEHIGYDKSDIQVQDGQVILSVPKNKVAQAVARVNLWVRHGERVLLSLGTFRATTFDDFFEGIEKMLGGMDSESFAFHGTDIPENPSCLASRLAKAYAKGNCQTFD